MLGQKPKNIPTITASITKQKCIKAADKILTNGKISILNTTFLTRYPYSSNAFEALETALEKYNQGTIPQINHKTNGISPTSPARKPNWNTTQYVIMEVKGCINAHTIPK